MSKNIRLKIVYVKIDDLKPAEYNPRKITNKVAYDIKNSIERYGIVDPIIVNGAKERFNVVIGGHLRLRVAKELGYEAVPCVYLNIPDIKKEKELNLRLNKNLGEWDIGLLAGFEKDLLYDVEFSSEELEGIFKNVGSDNREERLVEDMELKAFEHYDYVVFVFRNVYDWIKTLQTFEIKDVNYSVVASKKKIGLGRVIDGAKLLEKLKV
jgi:hypothetical protein